MNKIKTLYAGYECNFPGVIVVFGSLGNVQKSVIVLEEHKFPIIGPDSPKKAVDIFFKIFITLKKSFPKASKATWQYISKYIYELQVKNEYSNVNLFNTRLIRHKELYLSKLKDKDASKNSQKKAKNTAIAVKKPPNKKRKLNE